MSYNFTCDDDLPECEDMRTNGGMTVHRYAVAGQSMFLVTGDVESMTFSDADETIRGFISGMDFDGIEWAVAMAEFGFDDAETPANDGDTNVRIWVRPNYCCTVEQGAPRAHYAYEDDPSDHLTFDTFADARAWIDDIEGRVYYTSNGEAGRPAYVIAK